MILLYLNYIIFKKYYIIIKYYMKTQNDNFEICLRYAVFQY